MNVIMVSELLSPSLSPGLPEEKVHFKFLMPKAFIFLLIPQQKNSVFLHSTPGLPVYEGASGNDKQ